MITINPNRLFLALAMFGLLFVANCGGPETAPWMQQHTEATR